MFLPRGGEDVHVFLRFCCVLLFEHYWYIYTVLGEETSEYTVALKILII